MEKGARAMTLPSDPSQTASSVNFAQALENLYTDLERILQTMTPKAKTEHTFVRRRPDDELVREIGAMPGRPRLYEIRERDLKVARHLYTGSGYSGIEVQVPVDIVYPGQDRDDAASWQAAAFSDWFQFSNLLLDSTSIVGSGIQARMAWDSPEIIPFVDDPWFLLRIRVTALLHVAQ